MRRESALDETQRWLQSVVMGNQPVESARGRVLPSATLEPAERAAIYAGMYEVRLREALDVDYPLLSDFLGEELWTELTELYLEAHPSRSYTLNRLGDHLPEFIEEIDGLPDPGFASALARYELSRTLVFDAAETPGLKPDELKDVPASDWERVSLVPVEAFRLGTYAYPVHRYDAGQRAAPGQQETWLVIYRRNFRVLSLELTEPAFALLGALARGDTLGAAIADVHAPQDRLFDWFRRWMAEGLFREIAVRE